jgi:hypothetical protein
MRPHEPARRFVWLALIRPAGTFSLQEKGRIRGKTTGPGTCVPGPDSRTDQRYQTIAAPAPTPFSPLVLEVPFTLNTQRPLSEMVEAPIAMADCPP